MLRGALSGTVWGVGAVCLVMGLGILPLLVAHPEGLIFVAFIFLSAALSAAPGAFLLGLPLTSFLRLARANVHSRLGFIALSVLAGAPLGLVNLLLSSAGGMLLQGRLPDWTGFLRNLNDGWWFPALIGGVGLGLGAGRVVWNDTRRSTTPSTLARRRFEEDEPT